MKNFKRIMAGFFICTMSILAFTGVAYADEGEKSSTDGKNTGVICKGVFIGGIDMSGKTESEANELLNEYVSDLQSKKITVSANGKSIKTTIKDLGYTLKENDFVTQALNIGTCGNVIKRYKDIKDVENGKLDYDLEFTYDEAKIEEFVNNEIDDCNIDPQEPSMTPKSSSIGTSNIADQFTYSEGSTGKSADAEDAIAKIKEKITNWNKEDISVEAEVKTENPKYTIDQLKGIDGKLGEYTTSFSSSSASRCQNVANAASKINGTVVYPGETFSTLSKITPLSSSNGYAEAGSYVKGKVVDSVGGGVCQVSTTLYNAVLQSELNIKVRNNHSMYVSYVDLAFDAMIAESSGSDFKFENNTDTPIYIEGGVSGKTITFRIYGKETRFSNRTIKFENKIIQEIQPGEDVITKDSSKDSSYYSVTQNAHKGYKVELYKVVYVDGAETDRVKINTSTYKATPRYITIGNKKTSDNIPDIEDVEVDEDEIPLTDNAEKATAAPKATAKPKATTAPAATSKPESTEE